MALLNLSLISKTLENLLSTYIEASDLWSGANFDVSAKPPDKLKGENILGNYLYHITENNHFKNSPPLGPELPPVRYTPMGLDLYYQLTPHCGDDESQDPHQEQLLLGLALKALHDSPIIDDATTNNRLRISLQSIPHNEAVSFWTASSSPLRLAAYYQVSVVFLEPEKSQRKSSRVLSYGVHTFAGIGPRLEGSENTLSFSVPNQGDHEITARPAQVPLKGIITFFGSNLKGDQTRLFLKNSKWDNPQEAEQAWDVSPTNDRVTANVQETISGKYVFPGIYSAVIEVTRRKQTSDGTTRNLRYKSNETPFAVTPDIANIKAIPLPDGKMKVIVTSHNNLFQKIHDGIQNEEDHIKDVQVYVGTDLYEQRDLGDDDIPHGLEPKLFAFTSSTHPQPSSLQLILSADLGSSESIPLRLFVNGVESPPRWIERPWLL